MSAIVKSSTPFIHKDILLKALEFLGVKYTLKPPSSLYLSSDHEEIITERVDFYGNQKFVYQNGRYVFEHDSSADNLFYEWRRENMKKYLTVSSFLSAVEKEYNRIINEILEELKRKQEEEEKRRLEEERKAFIENQKQAIIKKAKEEGYTIEEKKVGNKIKLILRRNIY